MKYDDYLDQMMQSLAGFKRFYLSCVNLPFFLTYKKAIPLVKNNEPQNRRLHATKYERIIFFFSKLYVTN